MKQTLLLLFNTLIINILIAQDATLRGTLFDANNNDPLITATAILRDAAGSMKGATTDFNGDYEITASAGEYTLEFTYIGYETQQQSLTLVAGETRVINATLKTAATLLQTATVTSGRYEKPLSEVTVSLEVIKPALIESVNSTSVDEVLEKVPGVTIVDGQANIRGGSGYSYGAG
ncbi:MAG: carboxypeptidase-like regulatory domain-containing protein, partial [Saprospiraceae bacterium]